MRRRAGFVFVAILIAAGAGGFFYWQHIHTVSTQAVATYKTPEEKSTYVRFVMEAYDLIEQNYWQKATDAQMANLFQLSLQKAAATSTPTATDRSSTAKMLASAFGGVVGDTAKEQLAVGTVQVALYNLTPAGRDELLTSEGQKTVQQTVQNVNPAGDLYSELGITASATAQQVAQAYARKRAELAASSSPAARQEIARAQYVRDVLSNPQSKAQYDANHAEPTVFAHRLGSTLYLDIDKMSPTTVSEFTTAIEQASTTPLESLIVDLRGNIGGALDQIPILLGLFLGNNQYVFDLFHKGDFVVERSTAGKLPELARFREIAVLTDNMTQSSAEVLTAALKRFHLATVVGTNTRGWGTVENTYPLTTSVDPNTKYGLMLVYGLTMREDNQPIDGVGVDPDISIKGKNWQPKLPQYFRSASLISAVARTATQPPLQ